MSNLLIFNPLQTIGEDHILVLKREEEYYDILLDWLEEKGYYTGGEIYYEGKENWYKNIEPSRQCRIDVIGVKNVDSQKRSLADEVELIGIVGENNSLTS